MYQTRVGSTANSRAPEYDARMTPGTVVRYSGKWLVNTGQRRGSAGRMRFMVQGCSCTQCNTGKWVCTDTENPSLDLYSAEELASDSSLQWLHIARENLVIVGKPSRRDDP